jgi:two-component system sensor histidine kinase YesM
MKRAERGEMVAIDHPKRGDYEIGRLIESYNDMVNNLRESIYRQYVLKSEQKKAELRILQSQINPHFLANTLYLIQSIARRDSNKIIPKVTQNLIGMFRYSIDGRTEVPIYEEIEQIKRYVEIQELRFPDRFSVSYDIDAGILDARMIKFILQPLVENAFYHGIERTSRPGQILVSIQESGDGDIRILVRDNGMGIDEHTLREIRKELHMQRDKLDFRDESKWLGLKNVCFRIQDYYGERYGLEINSVLHKGTTVRVLISKRSAHIDDHLPLEIRS